MIVRSALCLALAIGAFALLDDDDIDYSIGPPLHDLTPYATQLLAAAEQEKPATGPMASSTETRARYYMGSWYDDQVTIERPDFSTDAQMDAPFLFNRTASARKDGTLCGRLPLSNQRYRYLRGTCTNYENDLALHIREAGLDSLETLVMFGDVSSASGQQQNGYAGGLPLLVKSRTISRHPQMRPGIVFNMNSRRHWQWLFEAKPSEPPWEQKKDAIVWRGSTTGLDDEQNVRFWYVSQLFKQHDVGFSQGVQGRRQWAEAPPVGWGRSELSFSEQLKYKYLLSLEGNDVATDLKWKLASGSLVFMPTPTKEGWLMEGLLRPWVHYVPVYTPDDLDAKLTWAREHDDWARGIVANATAHMQQFAELGRERDIISTMLWRYKENVHIE